MSSTGDSTQEWHAIRPWAPPLSLSVREISSVSATFILSSSLHDVDDHLALESEAHDGDGDGSSLTGAIISDVLAKGLSVNVNEAPWQRVLIRIDDKVDEAVIIIYGLMPGRQYDIDLGLVQGSESNIIRRQVITEDFEFPKVDETTIEDESSSSSSDQGAPSTPSSSVSAGRPAVVNGSPPSSVASSFTMEDRLAQVEHTLAALVTEKETLAQALKSARREAQKTDAALRSEIDALKRTSEKNSIAEQRARQRVLALQESLKRANAAREELEEEAAALEESLPALEATRDEREAAHRELKRAADVARKARERSQEKARKKTAAMEGELAALDGRAERLHAKRTKLEGTVLPDLEEQLRVLEQELQRAEMEELYGGELDIEPLNADVSEFGEVFAHPLFPPRTTPIRAPTYPPLAGTVPGIITRPSGHRPVSHHTAPRAHGAHHHRHHFHHHSHPNGKAGSRGAPLLSSSSGTHLSSGSSSSSHLATASVPSATSRSQGSTLSSAAPPFEPGRPIRTVVATTSGSAGLGSGTVAVPIQRPVH